MKNAKNVRKGLIINGVIVINKKLYHVCNSKYLHAEAYIVKLIKTTIKKHGIDRTLKMIHKQQIILYRQRDDKTIGSAKCCHYCCHMLRRELPSQILKKLTIIWSDNDGKFYQIIANKIWNNHLTLKERISRSKKLTKKSKCG